MKEETLFSEEVFHGHLIRVRKDTIRRADGVQTQREIVEHRAVIAVVAINQAGNFLLVKQYRKPTEQELLEIPAGGIEAGEDPEAAVYREMQEETGFLPKQVKRMAGFYSAPGFCDEYIHLFLASELTPSRLYAEDTDEIELVEIAPDEIEGLIASEKICDGKTIAGLLTYLAYYGK